MSKKEIHQWIQELLKDIKDPVIFECGANTGSDTVKLASIPGATVHAFEPEPRCDLSKMPQNVVVNKLAVSDKTGEATFNMSDAAGHEWTYSSSLLPPKNHLAAHRHVKFVRQVKVKTITLDEYCLANNIDHIDFLWMDVQGAEGKVFEGAEKILRKTRHIYTEYSNEEMYAGQPALPVILEILKVFEVVEIWPVEPSNVLLSNPVFERKIMVRIDDFPTGVRPIPDDLSIYFKILDEFEKRGIYFYLGIVPETFRKYVNEADKNKLRGYKFLIPCQHGFTHRYGENSMKIIESGDLRNKNTVGTFNEFEGMSRLEVKTAISKGRHYLEKYFCRTVTHYIPVCNIIDNMLVQALTELNFGYIFTQPYSPKVDHLQPIISKFNKRISDLDNSINGCISLHIPWEHDFILENGWEAWVSKIDGYFGSDGKNVNYFSADSTQPEITQGQIPKVANFFWNRETPLSFLRYLSLASFRYHHPDWEINLYLAYTNISNRWKTFEQQDFEARYVAKDYISKLIGIGVNIINYKNEYSGSLAPTFIADLARWEFLQKGGWFFDNDQVFLRPFDDLCGFDFILGADNHVCIGVIGASAGCKLTDLVIEEQRHQLNEKKGNPDVYCELGNSILIKLFKTDSWKNEAASWMVWNTPQNYFYPVHESNKLQDYIHNPENSLPVDGTNYALHWFGGHPTNQVFNKNYTEDYARKSADIISVYLRKINLV